jgi:DNA-directed RNA polymerase specialized sigma24 family protein
LKTHTSLATKKYFKATGPPNQDVDINLARRIGDGDQEALRMFVDRHIGPVYKYLRRRLGQGHDELIGKVMVATFDDALKRLPRYARASTSTPVRFWLFGRASSHLARMQPKPDKAQDQSPSEVPELTTLRAAMAMLPAPQQAVLCYALFEEMRPREIAWAIGATLPRAMRLLRSALRRVNGIRSVEEREPHA